MSVRRWFMASGVAIALLLSVVGMTPVAQAAPMSSAHARPALGCRYRVVELGQVGKSTNDNGVSGTIYAKVYEELFNDPDTNTCLHDVFAEATWVSSGGPATGGTMTANLKSGSGVEYQQNSRNIAGLTEGSIDTARSERGDSCFVAFTGTNWGDSGVSTGCLNILP